jgi:hypothetical protein
MGYCERQFKRLMKNRPLPGKAPGKIAKTGLKTIKTGFHLFNI